MSFVKNLSQAQEIVQEVFVRLMDRSPEDVNNYLKEWLFRVCRNLCIDELRKKGVKKEKELSVEMYFYNNSENMFDKFVSQEMKEIISHIIKELKAEQQEVLRLKFYEDLSYKQISQITGYSVSHVGVLIHNTLKKMRESIPRGEK